MFRPHGSTASIAMPGTVNMIGAIVKIRPEAVFGCSTSFCINLIASDIGWRSPNGPAGSGQAGPHPSTTRRSTQMLMTATPMKLMMLSARKVTHADQPCTAIIDDVEERAADIREVANIPPVIGHDGQERQHDHRSNSPTLMSMLPSVTIASAMLFPTVISLSTLRLISEGARTCHRYGAGPASLTT
jgi:hypothetical protein